MAITFHPFTDVDWMGFAGCEPFADGSEPLMSDDSSDCVILMDANGLHCARYTEDGYELGTADLSPIDAARFLATNPEPTWEAISTAPGATLEGFPGVQYGRELPDVALLGVWLKGSPNDLIYGPDWTFLPADGIAAHAGFAGGFAPYPQPGWDNHDPAPWVVGRAVLESAGTIRDELVTFTVHEPVNFDDDPTWRP